MTCWHDIFSVKHEHFDVLINSVKITHTQMTEGRRSKTSLNTAEINFDEVYTNYADKNI